MEKTLERQARRRQLTAPASLGLHFDCHLYPKRSSARRSSTHPSSPLRLSSLFNLCLSLSLLSLSPSTSSSSSLLPRDSPHFPESPSIVPCFFNSCRQILCNQSHDPLSVLATFGTLFDPSPANDLSTTEAVLTA